MEVRVEQLGRAPDGCRISKRYAWKTICDQSFLLQRIFLCTLTVAPVISSPFGRSKTKRKLRVTNVIGSDCDPDGLNITSPNTAHIFSIDIRSWSQPLLPIFFFGVTSSFIVGP